MNRSRRGSGSLRLAALAALFASAAAAADLDAPQLTGAQTLEPGMGGLVLVLSVSNHADVSTETWDAWLLRAADGARVRLMDVTRPAVHALPAGRYWLESARSRGGLVINGIGTPARWIEVADGRIGYAGRWQVMSTVNLDLQSSIKTEVSFPREPLEALAADPAGPLARYGFALAAVGKPQQKIGEKK